jgi:uncharacterized protein YndB with AHSA1/START domain
MPRSIVHGSFTITRHWKHAPIRVFNAFAKEEEKAKWFAGPGKWELHERIFDFREGGREVVSGKHDGGTVHSFDCIYRDILAPTAGEPGRIIYSYMMHLDDRKISVSHATIEIAPEGAGSKLVVNEYGDFLDGYDDAGSREHGTNFLMDRLDKSLAS